MLKKTARSLIIFSWNAPENTVSLCEGADRSFDTCIYVSPFALPKRLESAIPAAQVQTVQGVPWDGSDHVALTRFSVKGLHALSPVTPLIKDLYPALRSRGTIDVDPVSTDTLKPTLASLKAPFSIVVDMPGHDQALLSMLKAAHVLPDVDTLVIRAMEGAYFEGVADRAGLINHLAAMDFQLTFSDEQDPDWPVLTFEVDHLARQRKDHEAQMDALRRALQAEVDQQTKALDAAERVLAQNRERLHRAIKENDTLKDEFDAQGEVQNRALEAVQAECAALQQALAASDKRANDAEADAKMARSERQSLVAENETAQAEIKRLGEECRGLAQQLEASQASVVERDKAAQTAVAERQKLADQVAQQEARIAALLSEKDAANKKLAEHQETIKRVVTERDSARKATDTIKAEAAKSADAHRAELAKHEDAHAALKAENAKLAKERAELQETVKRAVTQRDAARAQTEQAQAENANKETALQESKTALEAALKDISAAKSTVSQKENELKAAWKRVESAETSQAETALALADARKRLKLAREEVRRAEGQIDLIKELLLAQARL